MKILNFVVAAAMGSALSYVAYADKARAKNVEVQLAAATASATGLTEGEIRKVDKDAKKLTIKHGPIQNLDMPPMTMVFQVKNPGMLDQVKAGDKVKFAVENTGGAYVVTHIETAK